MHLHPRLVARLGLCACSYRLPPLEKRGADATTAGRSTSLSAGSAAGNLRGAWTATGDADARSRSQLPAAFAWLSAYAVARASVPGARV